MEKDGHGTSMKLKSGSRTEVKMEIIKAGYLFTRTFRVDYRRWLHSLGICTYNIVQKFDDLLRYAP